MRLSFGRLGIISQGPEAYASSMVHICSHIIDGCTHDQKQLGPHKPFLQVLMAAPEIAHGVGLQRGKVGPS